MHTITIRFFPVWDECRAECECGWTGSYLATRNGAMREWDRHVDNAEIAAIEEGR